jgi:hypothetical protein
MISKLDELLFAETGIPVRVTEGPLLSVAEGTAKIPGDVYLLGRLTRMFPGAQSRSLARPRAKDGNIRMALEPRSL